MGDAIVRAGVSSISVGIAALAVGIAVKSAWIDRAAGSTPAERPGISVLQTKRPVDLRSSTSPVRTVSEPVRLASLEPDVGLGEVDDSPEQDAASADRFEERFGAAFSGAAVAEDSSVVFGKPFMPMPLSGGAPASGAASAPARAQASIMLPPPRPAIARPVLASLPEKPEKILPEKTAPSAETPADENPDPGARTAVYDISAHVVYLPNGDRLEAHSGLGSALDDPRLVHLKGRGPTPPNVYQLSMRERLFHGVRAIRLTPIGGGKMYGRDGMLAHSYMLGPNGDSNGCVSFNDYNAFLNAFQRGEVDRLVVVDHLASPPIAKAGSGWIPQALKDLFKTSQSAFASQRGS